MHLERVCQSKLFKMMDQSEIKEILDTFHILKKDFEKDQVIVLEGDECSFVGLILSGMVEVKKSSVSGKEYTITTLSQGDTFGEAVIFSSANTFPATIVSKTKTEVIFIPKHAIIEMCKKNEKFLHNFLNLLSDRILLLNTKLKENTLSTLRQKICNFLIEEYKKQKTTKLKLNLTKQELAKIFNVQRPSLSRELIKMKEEGLIDFWGKEIWVKDLEKIEEYLYEDA
ncbi:CRP-like cAMP-binding protein [Caldicellulosiruptor bescii]|uniref:Cyclic nucleotide-binding protein n=2 Tax=Caldicellulosiruptor bescii TaxID=31899 RepID=B9MRG7_CALBD|nr:Crp/Fnr family transcriptional regulator [Caldicellulosiruptor bescii]ACM60271.1 cyclic nucleotide-binding protein [Caldicellulosiruptor bescii DSM 6725]PBC87686.1 CRP-like cAMP-binding protein [Caldicellulosiruptor bescii]PBC90619.1 CRP-like cAMP-binding protein [Caldicellulosiruptor bescii]PBD03948.1 CRP-like cAMP-binding protein [Caldicellulosiruptor bescii]PBD06416.1 CRP-like cAMP-binding protein [Caldicellulosiruptor bescii]